MGRRRYVWLGLRVLTQDEEELEPHGVRGRHFKPEERAALRAAQRQRDRLQAEQRRREPCRSNRRDFVRALKRHLNEKEGAGSPR